MNLSYAREGWSRFILEAKIVKGWKLNKALVYTRYIVLYILNKRFLLNPLNNNIHFIDIVY